MTYLGLVLALTALALTLLVCEIGLVALVPRVLGVRAGLHKDFLLFLLLHKMAGTCQHKCPLTCVP